MSRAQLNKAIDLRKDVLDKVSERLGKHTLSNISEYEAVLLSILTYINQSDDIDPQKLIEYYLDYKLSVSAHARKDLLELFKAMIGSPTEEEASKEGEKRNWRIF